MTADGRVKHRTRANKGHIAAGVRRVGVIVIWWGHFQKGDSVKYIGKGFIRFDKEMPYATFIEYAGRHDAYIEYKKNRVLVYTHEIEAMEGGK